MRFILPALAIACSLSLSAQTILFSDHTEHPQPNIERVNLSDIPNDEFYDGRFYRLLQFDHIPNATERRALSAQGIELLEYIPHNTYIASLIDGMNANILSANGVKWVGEVNSNMKVHKWLFQRPFPKYAVEGDRVKVFIRFHGDVNYESARAVLLTAGIEIGHEFAYANVLEAAVNQELIFDVAELPFVAYMDLVSEPGKPESLEGQVQHRSNAINSPTYGGLKYDGTGVSIAINDDGAVGPHIDYTGRVDQSDFTPGTFGGTHGDMTAGIAGGGGNLDPTGQGMAPGAFLWIRQYSGSLPNTVTLHTNNNVMAFSSSYSNGCNAGYTSLTQLVDQETKDHPTLIQSFSAGNSNNSDCGYGAGNQWGNVTGGHKIAKNAIAAANLFQDESLVSSSSHGPASDGRIKPDIASHGQGQLSTDPNNTYAAGGGTSAACPGITGIFAQLVHAHRDLNAGADAESGLLKACMLNTAHDLGNVGPDFKFGWGRVNAWRAYEVLEDGRYFDATVDQGASNTHNITIPAGVEEARIMVYWMDPAASTSASKALVNDLDMTISDGATTYLPWVLDPTPDPALLDLPAANGIDTLNNMEQVSLTSPTPGSYTLTVNGTEVPMGPQKYYVVYEFFQGVRLTYPIGGEGLDPGTTEMIAWDAVGTATTFDLDYSTDAGATWTSISTGIAGNVRQFNWSIPNMPSGDVLVRVTRGADSDMSDEELSIIDVPTNLQVTAVCPSYMRVTWNPVASATQYAVHVLGAMYMDSIDVTGLTTYDIPIANPIDEQWFAVTAYGPNGMRSRRANAVQFAGNGPLNCPVANDAAIAAIISPSGTFISCGSLVTPIVVELANPGLNDESNIPVNYSFNGGATVTEIYAPVLPANSTVTYTFIPTITLDVVGPNQLEVWTSLVGDLAGYNDTMIVDISVLGGAGSSAPILENFDAQSLCGTANDCGATTCALTGNWLNLSNGTDDDIDWRVLAGPTGSAGTGPTVDATTSSATGQYIYLETSGTCVAQEAVLISPCIDLSGTTAPELTFSRHMYGATMGELHVDLFDGTSWINDFSPAVIGDQGDTWVPVVVSLSAYVGSTIVIRFRGISGSSFTSDMALDDLYVGDPPACPAVSAVAASSLAQAEMTVNWSCVGCVGSYYVEYGPVGFVPGTGATIGGGDAIVTTTNQTLTISSLTTCVAYDVYVRQDCSVDGFSFNSVVASASILGTVTAPFSQSFDTWSSADASVPCGGIDNAQDCWSNDAADANDWTARSIATGSGGTGPSADNTGSGNFLYVEASSPCSPSVAAAINSPLIDVSALTVPQLTFYYHMLGVNMGTLDVLVSVDGGTTFDPTPAWTLSGDQGDQWFEANVDLSAYAATNSTLLIRWLGTSGAGFESDMAIDDVSIVEAPTCPRPNMVNITNVGADGADVNWQCLNCTGTINLEYGPTGFAAGSGTTLLNVSSGVQLIGLNSSSDYDVFVWQDCGAGDLSLLSNVVSFITAPGCGDAFNDNGGAAAPYLNNSNEVFTICPSNAGERVRLTLSSFDVETSWDAFYVFDGNSTAAPMIASANAAPQGNNVFGAGGWWGTTIPGPFVSSDPNGCITVAFTSDGSVQNAGWEGAITCEPQTVMLDINVMLQGPFDATTGLMHDSLRTLGLIPLTEPYSALGYTGVSGATSMDASVLAVQGDNAIVDWVLVELRDELQPSTILRSTPALLQRDGDVVGVDGNALVEIALSSATMFVSVRHRNHLGVMSASALMLSGAPTILDLSDPATLVHGTDAQYTNGTVTMLWMGNTTNDGALKYTGSTNDRDPILVAIGGSSPTNIVTGYLQTDCNLDGLVKYVGSGNDRDPILVNVGGNAPTTVKLEQLP